ncbi:hypothetical protein RRG08_054097 [Elysia crispata]|uniref:Tumor protein p53-inducible protein 11 n=1 Tax=Elysia crispata TaxID=231223 RepID=A0AAE0ZCS4_9GAST|nr:hypothetical protein RRG08_054097 [Elysia crispata]
MERKESPTPSSNTRSFNFSSTPPPSPLALYCSSTPAKDSPSPPSPPTSPSSKTMTNTATAADESAPAEESVPTSGQDTPQCPSMVNQFFKLLLRKHSSGDLHSRLKTRKLLGVGETDDGDIHRSKLSQILGHSDQLYIRLPYGLRVWQLLLALMFSVVGAWAIILPSRLFQSAVEFGDGDHVTLPIRLYGGALVSLSLVFWMTLNSQDRDTIRMCLLASIVYFTIQIIVTTGHLLVYTRSPEQRYHLMVLQASRTGFTLTSVFYHWALTQRKFCPGGSASSSMRRNTSSGKDLGAAGGGSLAAGSLGSGGGGGGGGRAVTTAALYNGTGGCSSNSSGGFAVGGVGDDDAGAAGAGVSFGAGVKSKDV